MSEESETAARYRSRAEALHTIASSTKDPSQQYVLRELAKDYERLGITLEAIDRSKQVLARFGKP